MARIISKGRNLSPGHVDAQERRELACAVQEAAQVATGGAVLEVELDLGDGEAGARSVDRHGGLHPESSREREQAPQRGPTHRPLPRDRRLQLESCTRPDRPAREADRDAESATALGGERPY